MQKAIGEKVGMFINTLSMAVAGFVLAYAKGWRLALVMTATIPLIACAAFFFVYTRKRISEYNLECYAAASEKAEEVFTSIKTVKALCGEAHESLLHEQKIKEAAYFTIRFGMLSGVAVGFFSLAKYLTFSLGYWYGGVLIAGRVVNSNDGAVYSGGTVLTIVLSIYIGSMVMGFAIPNIQIFSEGNAAIEKIEAVIKRPSLELPNAEGLAPQDLRGEIEFKRVLFSYPTRPDSLVLRHVSFCIQRGVRNAIVGESGSGKSTVLQLLLMFYRPQEGLVLVDGHEIGKYQLKWLRQRIGYVGQEPVLFAASIRDNLLYGRAEATDDEIWQALTEAEAAAFVR